MVTTMTFQDLVEVLLRMDGAFILQNPHGSMELRGTDFYPSLAKDWITIYHTTKPRSPESRSHLHLKWRTLRSAKIGRAEGHSPHLEFFGTPEPGDDPMLIWYFPSFYDWSNGKAEIPANIAQYDAFVRDYGTTIQFVEPSD